MIWNCLCSLPWSWSISHSSRLLYRLNSSRSWFSNGISKFCQWLHYKDSAPLPTNWCVNSWSFVLSPAVWFSLDSNWLPPGVSSSAYLAYRVWDLARRLSGFDSPSLASERLASPISIESAHFWPWISFHWFPFSHFQHIIWQISLIWRNSGLKAHFPWFWLSAYLWAIQSTFHIFERYGSAAAITICGRWLTAVCSFSQVTGSWTSMLLACLLKNQLVSALSHFCFDPFIYLLILPVLIHDISEVDSSIDVVIYLMELTGCCSGWASRFYSYYFPLEYSWHSTAPSLSETILQGGSLALLSRYSIDSNWYSWRCCLCMDSWNLERYWSHRTRQISSQNQPSCKSSAQVQNQPSLRSFECSTPASQPYRMAGFAQGPSWCYSLIYFVWLLTLIQ